VEGKGGKEILKVPRRPIHRYIEFLKGVKKCGKKKTLMRSELIPHGRRHQKKKDALPADMKIG